MRPSEILAAKADQIREVIARYPVRNPRVFGSAARGDDTEGSDLDLLVDPLDRTTVQSATRPSVSTFSMTATRPCAPLPMAEGG